MASANITRFIGLRQMIISVHIPKTAGRSFQHLLQKRFVARMLSDYGDWLESNTPEAEAHNRRRRQEVIAKLETFSAEYDIIHGHFRASKYLRLFPTMKMLCFVRDPYQHTISAYEQAQRFPTRPDRTDEHPGIRRFQEEQMTLLDFIEAFPNHQSLYVANISLDEFAMIGITEQYEKSIALFGFVFGVDLQRMAQRRNVNPARDSSAYDIPPDVRKAIDRYRGEDVELYRRAQERFAFLARQHDL
jgi:hypothetical protein